MLQSTFWSLHCAFAANHFDDWVAHGPTEEVEFDFITHHLAINCPVIQVKTSSPRTAREFCLLVKAPDLVRVLAKVAQAKACPDIEIPARLSKHPVHLAQQRHMPNAEVEQERRDAVFDVKNAEAVLPTEVMKSHRVEFEYE